MWMEFCSPEDGLNDKYLIAFVTISIPFFISFYTLAVKDKKKENKQTTKQNATYFQTSVEFVYFVWKNLYFTALNFVQLLNCNWKLVEK